MKPRQFAMVILCILILAAAVGGASENVAEGPFGRFPEPVAMSIGRGIVADAAFPEGQDMDNNMYIDLCKESLNIDISYAWLAGSITDGDAYTTKVNLVIASGDMPDVMYVGNRTQLTQLAEAGMLADLQEAYDTYASDVTRGFYESYIYPNDLDGLETCRYNGELVALPNTNLAYQYTITWIRADWMEKVGETAPETLDDIIRIAKAFVEQDPGENGPGKTVGITVNNGMVGYYNAVSCLDNIFSYYQSYPRVWVQDPATGVYSYGTTLPETKKALAKVAEMYKDGIIDPQFATNDFTQVIAAGQCGIVLGPWWQPWWPLEATLEQGNPDIYWIPYIAPIADDGNYYQPYPNPHTNWMVVNKDYPHADAVVKMFNLTNFMLGQQAQADELIPNTTSEFGPVYDQLNKSWSVWPFPIQMIWNDNMLRLAADLRKNIDAGNNFADNPSFDMYIQGYNGFLTNPGADINQTVMYMNTTSVLLQAEKDHLLRYPLLGFPGTTETMVTRLGNLETLENQALMEIIMGQQPIEYFDTFVDQWNNQGGAQITEEVNAALNR